MAEKFELETIQLDKVSVHQVGNKTNGEDLIISQDLLDLSDVKLKDLLMKFFVTSFNNPEFYNFSFSNNDFTLNPIYSYALQMFEHGNAFHINSVNIAKHLYELSIHPQIKSGDLFVAYFPNIQVEDEDVFMHLLKIRNGGDNNNLIFLKMDGQRQQMVEVPEFKALRPEGATSRRR